MRQKYLISRNLERKELSIMEYAVLNKNLNKVAPENLREDNFSLVGEETYESELIKASISSGNHALVEILRTRNIFPIGQYACKIAETIKELYRLSEDGAMELFFDDMDLISVE